MRRRPIIGGAGLFMSASLLFFFRQSGGFALFFADRVSAPIGDALSRFSEKIAFPVFELLVMVSAAGFALYLVSAALRAAFERKIAPLLAFCANLLLFASAIVLSYTLTWPAQLYAQPIGQPLLSTHESSDLESLCLKMIREATALYTELPLGRSSLSEVIARSPGLVSGVPGVKRTPVAPKLARYPELFQGLNIAGLYAAWTGEALINPLEASVTIPFVACHETAHVVGFAREDDANYIAYLACMNGDAEFRYSGTLSALYYAMEMLRAENPSAWERARAAFGGGAYADFYAMNGFRDAAVTASVARNDEIADAFLRFGGQNGLSSYPQMILRLLEINRE